MEGRQRRGGGRDWEARREVKLWLDCRKNILKSLQKTIRIFQNVRLSGHHLTCTAYVATEGKDFMCDKDLGWSSQVLLSGHINLVYLWC